MSGILLIAATTGYQTHSLARAARELGAEVTLATDRCHILEDPWADRAVAVRFEEPESSALALADIARSRGIQALAAVADKPTVLAATTAKRLGIEWHPVSAALLCRDKHAMRGRFRAAGLNAPRDRLLGHGDNSLGIARHPGYPCVVKPTDMSASLGVIRADSAEEFRSALRTVRAIAGGGQAPVQVEEYVPGREFALEALMTGGELSPLAIFDKPDPLEGPFFEETIYVTPSRESSATQAAIIDTTRQAARALGLWHGPIHAEMRVNEAGVWMLEIAARPIGGLCARSLRFRAAEFDDSLTLEHLVVLHALGRMPREIVPASPASGVMMIPVPRAGVLQSVSGVENARAVQGVDDVIVTAKIGGKLILPPEGASYPGFIFASGPSPLFVETVLREAHARLVFEVLADLPVIGRQAP